MREFRTSCIDNVTGMEMVLSECSYNMACDWLERKGFTHYNYFEVCGTETILEFTTPKKRTFIYDEERGILLGD